MSKKSLIVKNSLTGIISQFTTVLFSFITRNFFIKYIGVELLGINSTFSSVLGTLSLAEMGVQTAITFSLYKPLNEDDKETINDIMNIFRTVYRSIGIFFSIASVVLLPFLKYILSDVDITSKIYIFFLLQAGISASSYFVAYKRALLYADKHDYISKNVDLICSVIFNTAQCIALIVLKSYSIYLILKIIQVISSNIIVNLYCNKQYDYLYKAKINKELLKRITKNIKNVFAGKISGYIYNATDNLVISIFVSTISVGFIVNYTTITKSIKMLTQSLFNPVIPFIGTYLIDSNNANEKQDRFLFYTFIRYLVALIVIVPLLVLIDDFIIIWIGESMVLESAIGILISIELYMDLLNNAAANFISASGLFKVEKNICIIGAMTNIVTSIVLVQQLGIIGVLVGTIISQCVFWLGRSYAVIFRCFELGKKEYIFYWLKNLFYVVIFVLTYSMCEFLYNFIDIQSLILKFLIGGLASEIIVIIVILLVFCRTKEYKILKHIIMKRK